MVKISDDRKKTTLETVRNFVDNEARIRDIMSEIKVEKTKLFEAIKDYVKIINSSFFDWVKSTDEVLRAGNYGCIDIKINERQPELFPKNELDFERYPVKQFPGLNGSIQVTINAVETETLKAKIIFGRTIGKFIWGKGDEDLFFSECNLAMDNPKFGNQDLFDLIELFNPALDWNRDGRVIKRRLRKNGEAMELRHPVDVINARLSQMLSVDRLLYG
jgi:hypothetical protein